MSMSYIRDYYKVPAKRGGRVRYAGSPKGVFDGTIIGTDGARLRVMLDHAPMGPGSVLVHPTWKIEYLEEPDV